MNIRKILGGSFTSNPSKQERQSINFKARAKHITAAAAPISKRAAEAITKPFQDAQGARKAIGGVSSMDTFERLGKTKSMNSFDDDAIFAYYNPADFIKTYVSRDVIKRAVIQNPHIKTILDKAGLLPIVDMRNVKTQEPLEHFVVTYEIAKKIARCEHLNGEEIGIVTKSSLVHDIAKALIPRAILEKPGKLTTSERAIIDLHADLGKEILRTTDLDPRIADIVGLHHTPVEKPEKGRNFLAQVVSTADVKSALEAKRSYKSAFSADVVAEILKQDAQDGRLNPKLVSDALR